MDTQVTTFTDPSKVLEAFDLPNDVHAQALPTVGESLDLLVRAKACRFRSPADCNCSNWGMCGLGKGSNGKVSMQECMECVKAGENIQVVTLSFDCGVVGVAHNLDGIGRGFSMASFYK